MSTCVSVLKKQGLAGDLPHAAENLVLLTFEVICEELELPSRACLRARICSLLPPSLASYGSTLGSAPSVVSWQEEDEFIVEGLLNISWGLRRPIRLQMQDDHERIRPPPSSSSWHSGCNLGAQG